MSLIEKSASYQNLLSKQLNRFSELSETLTLRLLDLEERVTAIENDQGLPENLSTERINSLLEKSKNTFKHLQNSLDRNRR